MTVFDYTGEVQTNKVPLYAWPIDFELEESVHYMGGTVLNPSTTDCLSLEVDIIPPDLSHNNKGLPIVYPSKDKIMTVAREVSEVTIPAVSMQLWDFGIGYLSVVSLSL